MGIRCFLLSFGGTDLFHSARPGHDPEVCIIPTSDNYCSGILIFFTSNKFVAATLALPFVLQGAYTDGASKRGCGVAHLMQVGPAFAIHLLSTAQKILLVQVKHLLDCYAPGGPIRVDSASVLRTR